MQPFLSLLLFVLKRTVNVLNFILSFHLCILKFIAHYMFNNTRIFHHFKFQINVTKYEIKFLYGIDINHISDPFTRVNRFQCLFSLNCLSFEKKIQNSIQFSSHLTLRTSGNCVKRFQQMVSIKVTCVF